MKREIKFRAKYFDEWYFGIIVTRKVKDRGRIRNLYILMGLDNENWIPLNEDQYDTIGQFTGLHDKNGKEIYEGDIIAVNGMQIGYIVGDVRGYCYDVIYTPAKSNGEKAWPLYSVVTIDYPNKCEVIGNIHDNPELLEGGEQ